MPSTVNNLWDSFIDFENIYRGYFSAARGKRYRNEVLSYKAKLEDNLFSLIEDLKNNNYKPLPFRRFHITNPKPREIEAPAFCDRVLHHSLDQIIEPIFEKRFINESYACRLGRGTHAAMRHVFKCTQLAKRQWGNYFVLKCDISKFFPSVNHDILKKIIRRAIWDKRLLCIIDLIIDFNSGIDGVGIPIGSLTSQLFANVYLDPLDHFLKETCRIKFYARYMDDFVILHNSKEYLRELLKKIETFLNERLELKLNPKTVIFPGKHAIDFCGYRIWPTHIKPRKRTVKRAKSRMRKMVKLYKDDPKILEHAKASLVSFMGYIKHCSGRRTIRSVLKVATFKKGKKPALPDK